MDTAPHRLGKRRRIECESLREGTSPPGLRRLVRKVRGEVRERDEGGESLAGVGPGLAALTPREREIGLLVAEGLRSAEIAERLFISPRTVEKHRANLMGKLGVSNAAGVTRELLYLCWNEEGGGEHPSTPRAPMPI